MFLWKPVEDRIVLKEQCPVVQNNEEVLHEVKPCKCTWRYW